MNLRSPLVRLFGVLSRHRKLQFFGLIGLMLVGALAELASIGAVVPFLQLIAAPEQSARTPVVAELVRLAGSETASQLLVPAAILLVAVALVSAAVRILLIWVSLRFAAALSHELSYTLFKKSLRQPYTVYIGRNSSEIVSAMDKINHVSTMVLVPALQAVSSAVIAFAILCLLFMVDPLVALIVGPVVGIFYAVLGTYSRIAALRTSRRYADLSTERIKAIQEGQGGLREIILDRSHNVFERHFSRLDLEYRLLLVKVGILVGAPRYVVEALGIGLIALIALYYETQPGGVVAAIPVLGALALGAQRLIPLLQNINSGMANYAGMSGMMADVLGLIEAPTLSMLPRPARADIVPLRSEITLQHVGFAYGEDRKALHNVDLVIRRGSRLGLIGRTGSGKSTLVDIVMGLLPPTTGAVLIDGVTLGDETVQNWQAQVAHVPQTIFLLDDTIAANIAFGVPGEAIDLERVRDAARRADVGGFVEGLREGYETKVGERGVRLSGGQRQRLGIARALYKQATVLILDEATSALDDATERAVMSGIEQLDRDLTIVIIAHRLSTVATCDLIVRLENGRVVEQGSYRDVIASRSEPAAA